MFPFKVLLVGCSECHLPDLRRELQLAAAGIEGEYRDVASLVAAQPTPGPEKRAVLVEVNSTAELTQVAWLNESYPGWPIMVLTEDSDNLALLRGAMRAGATQVVALPLQPEDFHAALTRLAVQFGRSVAPSRVIAVTGVTEGCGATTLAINLASEIASLHHHRSILVELALPVGRLAGYLDVEPKFTTADLLSDVDYLDVPVVRQALTPVHENFSILAGPYRSLTPLSVPPVNVVRLLNCARQLAPVLVVDMPYSYDDAYFQTLAVANRIVVVAEQTVPSIHALQLFCDTLQSRSGFGPLFPVLNHYHPGLAGFDAQQLQQRLKLPRIWTVADDRHQVTEAINNGRTLRQQAPRSPVLADIDRLAAALLNIPEPPPIETGLRGWWRRLSRRFYLPLATSKAVDPSGEWKPVSDIP
ncbi:MAG: hypothetical protein NZ700_09945 [Gemmataceae bacterium]|nr:hypothetical protein [Gemmataceae bacterium]MDW8264878.1 hypothetical protein [Gemmataceae bacterium]